MATQGDQDNNNSFDLGKMLIAFFKMLFTLLTGGIFSGGANEDETSTTTVLPHPAAHVPPPPADGQPNLLEQGIHFVQNILSGGHGHRPDYRKLNTSVSSTSCPTSSGFSAQVRNAIDSAARKHGCSALDLSAIATIESGGRPDATNPSGASGLFQFMPSTAQSYGLRNPLDPVASADAGARLMNDNRSYLESTLHRSVTGGELYLAHQQGPGGACALLKDPSANVVDVLARVYDGHRGTAREAVIENGGNVNMTAGQFAGLWTGKFDEVSQRLAGAPHPSTVVSQAHGNSNQRRLMTQFTA